MTLKLLCDGQQGMNFVLEKIRCVDTAYFLLWLSGNYLLNAPYEMKMHCREIYFN